MPRYEITRRKRETLATYDNARDAAGFITSDDDYIDDIEFDIDETIDECYGSIEICGERFYASNILRNLDEYAYFDFLSDEKRNAAECNLDFVQGQLEDLSPGEELSFEGGICVICADDDDNDDNTGLTGFESVFE